MKKVNIPGFTAKTSLRNKVVRFRTPVLINFPYVVEPAFPRGRGFNTLPTCREENCRTEIVYEVCGSAIDGFPAPMCQAGTRTRCDSVCTFPSGVKGGLY